MTLIEIVEVVVLCDDRPGHARRKQRIVPDLRPGTLVPDATWGGWAIEAAHGGSVPNAYKYRATTEGRACVIAPDGRAVVGYCELNANKVSLVGVVGAALHQRCRPLLDGRRSDSSGRGASWEVMEWAWAAARCLWARAYDPTGVGDGPALDAYADTLTWMDEVEATHARSERLRRELCGNVSPVKGNWPRTLARLG
jgi:hypothetical protein